MTTFIHKPEKISDISAKTIHYYYDSIGLMFDLDRAAKNYRQNTLPQLRVCDTLPARGAWASVSPRETKGHFPVSVMDLIDGRINATNRRISELLALREALNGFRRLGASLSPSKKCDESCTDYMVEQVQEYGLVSLSIEGNQSVPAKGDDLK
jgi:hypothetical protein